MRPQAEVGFHSIDLNFEDSVTQAELVSAIDGLNADSKIHGILVQLPLPAQIDEAALLERIDVAKDVDGFSASNIGNMCLKGGRPPLALPCTPAGCVELLQRSDVRVSGKDAVVLGRSNIVGMPVAHLLTSMDATVTVCHSRTADLAAHVRRADIVIAAIGKAEMVPGEWIKPGAVVIDVGVNSKDAPDTPKGYKLCGDVDFASASKVAGAITPVPGGVGPMTVRPHCTRVLERNTPAQRSRRASTHLYPCT
jgi:5,10-methylene-tetrahydrofolate dehydrogenase/methenyl tetrahydrofolate cyclohydrolase